jgi:CDP-glucose 4,6-dehydratase
MGIGYCTMEKMVTPSLQNSADFWFGKHVLLTGHSGFKGSWLALWLTSLGAEVTGVSLPPATTPDLFSLANIGAKLSSHFCDIRDAAALSSIVQTVRPEVVFHLAAQPLVRASYADPIGTITSNVIGSANLLEALRGTDSVRVVIMVTTDKVYQNLEQPYPYREGDALGGHDPYSASKAASEIIIASYRDSFLAKQGVAVATARAGNVIGGGDWSNDRLIPDAVRAWENGQTLDIRRPLAIRPWQHVLEPLHGYMTLAKHLWCNPNLAGAWNFGPNPHEASTVRDVVEYARQAYGSGDVRYGDGNLGPHEAGWLALETSKARLELGLRPKWGLQEAVGRTMSWYKAQRQGANVHTLCLDEISAYEAAEAHS